jgi:hypothetical protein
MRAAIGLISALLCTLAVLTDAGAAGRKIAVVAAQNFYGDVAQQIGGEQVAVVNILNDPRPGPASIRNRAVHRPRDRSGAVGHLQWRRLRQLQQQRKCRVQDR